MAGPDSLYSHSWFLYPRASPVPLSSMAALYFSTVAVFLQHEHLDYCSLHISGVINPQIKVLNGYIQQLTVLIGIVSVCFIFL